jgi:hypothetical protein
MMAGAGFEPARRRSIGAGPLRDAFRPASTLVLTLARVSVIPLLLSSCASSLPERTLVPVATTCVPSTTPALPPTLAESELAALSDYALVLRIAAERLELLAYSKQAEIVISGCR